MALGDLLSLLQVPQAQADPSVMSGLAPQGTYAPAPAFGTPTAAPQPAPPQPSAPPTDPTQVMAPQALTSLDGSLMQQDPNTLLGHHVNNLLQVTGNLQPPPGVSVPGDQTQANIPGGSHADPVNPQTNQPMAGAVSPDPSDPHAWRDAVNGPFKTHGVVGDILGHVMDMVLVSAGLKPEYGPRSMAAKEQDAIQNGGANPAQVLANLGGVAGPAAATAYQTGNDAHQTAQLGLAKTQADIDEIPVKAQLAKAQVAVEQAKVHDAQRDRQATMASQFLTLKPGDPKSEALARAVYGKIKADRTANGDTTDDLEPTVEGMQNLARGAIKPADALRISNATEHDRSLEADSHAHVAIDQTGLGIRAAEAAANIAHANAETTRIKQGPADGSTPGTKAAIAQARLQDLADKHVGSILKAKVTAQMNGLPDPYPNVTPSPGAVAGHLASAAPSSNAPPPSAAAQYKGHTVTVGTSHWFSDGKGWHPAKGQ